MDYSEMQLAIEVHKIATSMRAIAREKAKKGLTDALAVARWDGKNTVMSFVPEALIQINEIAAIIRGNQS